MEPLLNITDKGVSLYKKNGKISKSIVGMIIIYILYKLYRKYKYSQQIFERSERSTKVVIITGCDTGFGNATAIKLSIDLGYKVIATCFKKESVDKFLLNKLFIANGSTSILLDVTNTEQIEALYKFTNKYLNDNHCILWGIINNAGIEIPGPFELVSSSMSKYQHDVLLNGPLNIIRYLLPLLHGRKQYKNNTMFGVSGGGRIVNISSISAKFPGPIRYGTAKCALSYFTHALRMELSPRFGIWCSVIEPAAFRTSIYKGMKIWLNKVINDAKQNNKELLVIYDKQIKRYQRLDDTKIPGMHDSFDKVINCIVHALNAKYPQREYEPGTDGINNIFWYLAPKIPLSMLEGILQFAAKNMDKQQNH